MTILPWCVEQYKRYIWAWKIKSKNRHISLGGPARFLWWWIVDKSLYYSKRKIFFQRGGFKEGRKKERRCYLYKSKSHTCTYVMIWLVTFFQDLFWREARFISCPSSQPICLGVDPKYVPALFSNRKFKPFFKAW